MAAVPSIYLLHSLVLRSPSTLSLIAFGYQSSLLCLHSALPRPSHLPVGWAVADGFLGWLAVIAWIMMLSAFVKIFQVGIMYVLKSQVQTRLVRGTLAPSLPPRTPPPTCQHRHML